MLLHAGYIAAVARVEVGPVDRNGIFEPARGFGIGCSAGARESVGHNEVEHIGGVESLSLDGFRSLFKFVAQSGFLLAVAEREIENARLGGVTDGQIKKQIVGRVEFYTFDETDPIIRFHRSLCQADARA